MSVIPRELSRCFTYNTSSAPIVARWLRGRGGSGSRLSAAGFSRIMGECGSFPPSVPMLISPAGDRNLPLNWIPQIISHRKNCQASDFYSTLTWVFIDGA